METTHNVPRLNVPSLDAMFQGIMEDSQEQSRHHHHGLFPPTGSPTSEKFISSLTVAMLILFFVMLRFSAGPFLHPSGEARIAASSSVYFNLCCFLLLWVTSSTILTIIPHFSSHYNGMIAAALFFPMVFSSIATLLCGRLIVRTFFYCLVHSGFYLSKISSLDANDRRRGMFKKEVREKRKMPKMIAFHRPFRKLAKSAATVSAGISLLHAHCWSRTLSVFKINKDDGAGAICRAVFSPLASSSEGAEEKTIWLLWGTIMFVIVLAFLQDELNGHHCRSEGSFSIQIKGFKLSAQKGATDDLKLDEYLDYSSDDTDVSADMTEPPRKGFFLHRAHNLDDVIPQETLPMVPWLSLVAAHSVIDVFLQLKVFLGRVDARLMQPALQERNRIKPTKKLKKKKINDPAKIFTYLQNKYPGCMYDYSSRKRTFDGGFWCDFMADCGDGFNSSYQVARLLAQQHITVKRNGVETKLPRGEFLVLGGDLAYPAPTEHSYEKRFFRTFEDAMAPPPSFRRSKIATDKLNICVKGWEEKKCFENCAAENAEDVNDNDMHVHYKGPSTFVVPGNHDWYDGLATYTRFILYRDFLGGWLMPQQRSYFAIKLVEGWWIFGLDCALASDIDIEQFKFFADVADNAVGDSDSVIIVNHEPHWVTDYDFRKEGDDLSERNICELMENHLRGKVRARLAGDLHHYTRHVPTKVASKSIPRNRSRSFSLDRISQRGRDPDKNIKSERVEPFTEDNRPELIVSGGGGAFLHGTNTFDRDIKVGPKQQSYTRVAAYPNEAVSTYLGWLNMYHFRWRGWRCDLIFALLYLGIVSSLIPLCGIYDDYDEFNTDHDFSLLCVWLTKTIGTLCVRVFTSERFSLLCLTSFSLLLLTLQAPEHHVQPAHRYFLAFCHIFGHIVAALTCLVFIQCAAEWIVKDHFVTLSTTTENYPFTPPEGSLAGSLYGEYKEHFYPILKNFTSGDHPAPSPAESLDMLTIIKATIEYGRTGLDFLFSHVPLLKTTLNIFDLPTIVAQNHHDMCSHLCADGVECLLSHDPMRFQTIRRGVFVPYLAAVTLYYIFMAVPIAGSIFGTWLAVSLNIFKSQCDLAFSSLQIQHYKNFVKLHIKDDGELEIFAIGLRKVPTKWVKDHKFDDCNSRKKRKEVIDPSWSLQYPSKWVPKHPAKNQDPEIIDYSCIPKRKIKQP